MSDATHHGDESLTIDDEYLDRVLTMLDDYGNHRNELFVTRRMAKEAAGVIRYLRQRDVNRLAAEAQTAIDAL